MIKTWSFYNQETGELSGRTFTGPEKAIAANTPIGLVAIEGSHNHLTMRVQDGAVVKRESQLPEHENLRALVLARIAGLESKGLRAMRELALTPNSTKARDVLTAINSQIATLRESIPTDNYPAAQNQMILPPPKADLQEPIRPDPPPPGIELHGNAAKPI